KLISGKRREQRRAKAQGQLELATQMYAASLLAIAVDTEKEKEYLHQLASGLGLDPPVVASIQKFVGLQTA
ncbi:MAG: DUF533 domain-containing protein, partial [Smithella sp.]